MNYKIAVIVLQIALIVLKMTNVIDRSWVWVLLPTYVAIGFCVLLAMVIVFMKLK